MLPIAFVIAAVLVCSAAYLVLYYSVKNELISLIPEYICEAESIGKHGDEKMMHVVCRLSRTVPFALKPILSDEKLRIMAQKAFGWIESYAEKNVEAMRKSIKAKEEQRIIAENADAAVSLLLSVLDMDAEQLMKTAQEVGVNIYSDMARDEVVRSVIIAMLRMA